MMMIMMMMMMMTNSYFLCLSCADGTFYVYTVYCHSLAVTSCNVCMKQQ